MNSTNTIGFTANTPQNLIIDAGALYKNYGLPSETPLGATSGGNTFTVKANTRQVKVDGIKGSAKGLEFVTDTAISFATNILEITSNTLGTLLRGDVDTTSDANYDIITGRSTIDDGDYLENIALVGKISGKDKPVIIILKNALSTDGLKWTTKDDTDNVVQCTFTAYLDPLHPNDLPYEIRYPKGTSTLPFNLNETPIIDDGKILLTFSDTAMAGAIPYSGFTAAVNGSSDTITAATRGVNDANVIELTLSTPPTAGEPVTIAYTKSETDASNVKSASGVALDTFDTINVINN